MKLNIKKVEYLKTLVVIILILFILGLTLYPRLFKNNATNEYFTTLRDYYLVDNMHLYNEDKAVKDSKCKSPLLNLQKALSHSSTVKHIDSNVSDKSLSKDLVPINVSRLGYINRLVEIKHGSLSLMVNSKGDLEFRNVKLDMKGYQTCTFKVVLGLNGPYTISLYHIPTDSFISRDAKGKLFLCNVELINEVTKQSSSYKLCYGLNNINNVTIACPMIHKENTPRVWQLKKGMLGVNNIPLMIKIDSVSPDDYSSIEFNFKDVNSGVILSTIYKEQHDIDRNIQNQCMLPSREEALGQHRTVEAYTNSNTTTNNSSAKRNMRNKTTVSGLLNEGILNMEEVGLGKQSLLNVVNSKLVSEDFISNVNKEQFESTNPTQKTNTNIFDVNIGKEFHNALTHDMVGKNYSELLDDKLVEKLQKQQLDPVAQSLLDYNEKYFNVYKKENEDFENKLSTFLDEHIINVDKNIRKANNYRVGQMAKQLFNAESILEEKTRI